MQYHRVAVAIMAVGIALSGCGKGGQAPKGPPPLNVDVASAQRRDISTSISLDGQIAPLEQSTLSFQQSGPITAIYANVGDRVNAGMLLAKIDDSTLRSQLAQAQAQANQQSATAAGAQVGLPSQQQQNNAALQTARAALANAQLIYNQDRQLFAQGYVSQAQLESARAAYVQAQSQANNAQSGLANNQVSAQNVKAQMAAAAAASANVNTLQTQIGQTSLYAPFDGVVTARMMDPGAFAGPQSPVLAISRVSTVWININVPDDDLSYVHSGSRVAFASSSLPGKTFNANVTTVNAVPTQGTLSYLARIQMPNPGGVLRGGMLVTATVTKERVNDAIVVPRTAVAQTEKGDAVYVVGPDNKAREVPVKVGVQTDTLAQVRSAEVSAGTKVITTRPDALKDGSIVAVNNTGAGAPQ
ncbi:MAG: efflux RND transporter periplasmic adaptor subunit [Candidatus Eremiobacteraeota bacterium]|nr:efflux RND transporter periplasmic adaptor subunit [Candidatus Eremiobacteraeota bacterium]